MRPEKEQKVETARFLFYFILLELQCKRRIVVCDHLGKKEKTQNALVCVT